VHIKIVTCLLKTIVVVLFALYMRKSMVTVVELLVVSNHGMLTQWLVFHLLIRPFGRRMFLIAVVLPFMGCVVLFEILIPVKLGSVMSPIMPIPTPMIRQLNLNLFNEPIISLLTEYTVLKLFVLHVG
jgi:hypothetical protein